MKTPLYSILMKTNNAQRAKLRPYMTDIGLSVGQPKVLTYLMRHDLCTQKDIATACDIEPATVSKLLDTMEEKGLLERRRQDGNRRCFAIGITEKGKLAQKKWAAHCKEVENEALQGFSEEEKIRLQEYLSRMYKNLSGRELE